MTRDSDRIFEIWLTNDVDWQRVALERAMRKVLEMGAGPDNPLFGYVEVEPMSTEPDAIAATKSTFELLGPAAGPEPFKEYEGKYYVREGFARFAAERQGYVKRVVLPTGAKAYEPYEPPKVPPFPSKP